MKQITKYILCLVLLQGSFYCTAQNKSNFGIGASGGFKTPNADGGFIFQYKLKNILDVYTGFSFSTYAGFGYLIGTDLFVTKKSWQPTVGISYSRMVGDKFSLGEYNINRALYEIEASDNIVGTVGVMKILLFDDESAKGFISFMPFLSYNYSNPSSSVIYVSGTVDANRESKINKRISNGLGAGIKLIYYFGEYTK